MAALQAFRSLRTSADSGAPRRAGARGGSPPEATWELRRGFSSSRQSERGFTLIETLIAAALGLIVVAAIYNVFIGQNRVYEFQNTVVQMNEAALTGMKVMLRDLRAAGYGDLSGDTLLTAQAKQIVFRADVDDDGTVDQVKFEQVTQDGSEVLTRTENATATQTLVRHLEPAAGIAFTYYDKSGAEVTDTSTQALRNTIRSIKLSITVRTRRLDSITGDYKIVKLESDVRPRNLP